MYFILHDNAIETLFILKVPCYLTCPVLLHIVATLR